MIKRTLFCFTACLLSLIGFAHDSAVVQAERQATGLRAEGKIYVVLAVTLTILIGLFIYLITLDRKISRIEKSS